MYSIKKLPLLLYMLRSELYKTGDMVVIQTVKHILAQLSRFDEPGIPQYPELVRYGRLVHAENRSQVTDAEFGSEEGMQNPYSRAISKNLEQSGKLLGLKGIWQSLSHGINKSGMRTGLVATVEV